MRFARRVAVVAGTVGVLSVAALAWSYWLQSGVGNASVGIGALAAPANVAATSTAGGTTASVTWTGVTGPDGGAVGGYYVQRYSGGVPSPACSSSPTALLGAGAASCNDSNVPDGSYTYAVTAVFHSWTAVSSRSAAVAVDALASFAVTAPVTTAAGASFTITVAAKDQSNNTITGYLGTVHFVSSDPQGAVLPTDYTFTTADNGAHAFANGGILKTVASQSITVNDSAEVSKTGAASVGVTAGAAAQVGFTQQPGGGTGAVVWTTQPKVTIQDAFGNTVTTSVASVTLTITAGTGNPSGVLTCTANPKAAVAGVATFAGCKINLAASGYTLTGSATGLSAATSSAFNVVAGVASQVVYTQQPSAVVAGSAITPAVVANIEDASGNTVTASGATVTVAISTNPGGGTLSGTLSISATNGVATFANLSIDKSGVGYKLTASSAGLTSAVSTAFNVTAGAAVQMTVTQQPNGGTGGVAWTTQPRVTIQDALGNTATTSIASVTLTITSGTGNPSGVLTCTANPKAAAAGVDLFAGCKINLPGTGYTLTAAATGFAPVTSGPFNVVVGPATQIVYTQQPTAVVAGSAISPAIVAAVEDAGGNTIASSNAAVTIAISTNPGGGTLTGTVSINATNGVVTFADLSIDKSGVGYKLTAASAGLTSAVSGTFNVNAGTAAQLAFTQQPGGGTGGIAWTTQPRVTIQDALGNTVTTSVASVTLTITAGTGNASGVLTCTANPKAAAAGVDLFAGCKINLTGTGYTLTASATGFAPVATIPFNVVVGAASQVVYTQQPTAVTAGSAMSPAIVATVEDAGGNTIASSSATVTVAISTNPGGGTLSGTLSVNATNGVATFANLSIDKSGVGYKLTASSPGLTSAVSAAFNVNVGVAAQVAFTQQPGGGAAGAVWAIQPKVTIQDALGNTVATSVASVTLTITSGTGNPSGVLTCTANPKAAAAGIVTFAGCKINLAGTGYTLTATATGLTSAVSNPFNIT